MKHSVQKKETKTKTKPSLCAARLKIYNIYSTKWQEYTDKNKEFQIYNKHGL